MYIGRALTCALLYDLLYQLNDRSILYCLVLALSSSWTLSSPRSFE